jgi:hypothetical protein
LQGPKGPQEDAVEPVDHPRGLLHGLRIRQPGRRPVPLLINPPLLGPRLIEGSVGEPLLPTVDVIGNSKMDLSQGSVSLFGSQVVQSKSRFHGRIRISLLGIPETVLHNARTLRPRQRMLHLDTDACQLAIRSLLSGGKFPSGRLFF